VAVIAILVPITSATTAVRLLLLRSGMVLLRRSCLRMRRLLLRHRMHFSARSLHALLLRLGLRTGNFHALLLRLCTKLSVRLWLR
jgi:hypothetical protein